MSLHHARLHAGKWAKARKAALVRAGYRSEITGRPGRLEVHHRVRLEDGGDPYDLDNLVVMARDEHIRLHEQDHLSPERKAWRDYLRNIASD